MKLESEYFDTGELSKEYAHYIEALVRKSRSDVLKMIHSAGTGHIGGSLSSLDIYAVLWACKRENDVVIISHGHTSAGAYAILGNIGYFDVDQAIAEFRQGGIFEGHPSLQVKGISWCSGILGQGLSVGCGMALARKMQGKSDLVYVVMGDGEQTKGQLQEARDFAAKYVLDNLIVIVDCNGMQASGQTENIMPQKFAEKYLASGWDLNLVDGHCVDALFRALKKSDNPKVIVASTIMGKGISIIENDYRYHGKQLDDFQYKLAMHELAVSDADIQTVQENKRSRNLPVESERSLLDMPKMVMLEVGQSRDCRSSFSDTIYHVIAANRDVDIAVFDCDLVESLKLSGCKEHFPEKLIECGIMEHHAVTTAAAMSKSGFLSIFVGFTVFALNECYSQHRMALINNAKIKLFLTHAGLDVGEDGKTHQAIDYLSLLSGLPEYKVMIPADANQAIHCTITALSMNHATTVITGRSQVPVLGNDGKTIFGSDYHFTFGKGDWLREGKDACIVTMGSMAYKAVMVADKFKQTGISISVLHISCPFELDEEKMIAASACGLVVTYEDHLASCGLGIRVAAFMTRKDLCCKTRHLGVTIPGISATSENNYLHQGLDANSLFELIQANLS